MTTEPSYSRATLLGLPLELRNEIYRDLLLTRRNKRSYIQGSRSYDLQPAILAINQQVHTEAKHIWHKNTFISLLTNWSNFEKDVLHPGKLPIVAKVKMNTCRAQTMTAFLHIEADDTCQPEWEYVICLEDLDLFGRLLFYNNCQSPNFLELLRMMLILRDPRAKQTKLPLPKSLQQSLIMPFAILKDLREITLKGLYSKDVDEDLKTALSKPNPTAGEYLDQAAAFKDEGNIAFKEQDYRRSVETYIKAYEAMHFIIEGKRFAIMLDGWYATTPLVGGRFEGKRGDLIRHQLGSQLCGNLTQAYLKLGEYQQAYMWAERSLSDIEYGNCQQQIWDSTPTLTTDAEKAKAHYRMVLACEGLKRPEWEIENNLVKAWGFAPNDPVIKKRVFKK